MGVGCGGGWFSREEERTGCGGRYLWGTRLGGVARTPRTAESEAELVMVGDGLARAKGGLACGLAGCCGLQARSKP